MSRVVKSIEMDKFMVTCLKCNDLIESKHERDYVSCKCGLIAIDGGPFVGGRILGNPENYIDSSTWREIVEKK